MKRHKEKGPPETDPARLKTRIAQLESRISEAESKSKNDLEKEAIYRLLVEFASDVIWATDMSFNFTYVSPSVTRLQGFTVEEVMAGGLPLLLTPESVQLGAKVLMEELAIEDTKDKALFRNRTFVMEYVCKDGRRGWSEVKTAFVRDEGLRPIGIVGISRDITERKKMEEEKERMQVLLTHSQKMEAIGQLAGGIAHDFNNLLTAIRGYTDLSLRSVGDDSPAREDLKEIRRACSQAGNLTRQLLLFSRRQPLNFQPVDLNRSIESALKMLGRLIGEHITIASLPQEGLWRISADTGCIEQVLMNLAVNARDVMPEGGKITIRTENMAVAEKDCPPGSGAAPGRYVRLSVRDTGTGIEENIIPRIFDPFFTTKGPKGTGLGLSVVYGIVKQHGGWIEVSSEPGRGSTFFIFFPITEEMPRQELGDGEASERYRGRGERILFIEDEIPVKKVFARMLKENGFNVAAATTAREAQDIFEKEGGHFDLVFSDVVLPDISGIRLVDSLLEKKPGLKILVSSGYTMEDTDWDIIQKRGLKFLQKPYALPELLKLIRELLDET